MAITNFKANPDSIENHSDDTERIKKETDSSREEVHASLKKVEPLPSRNDIHLARKLFHMVGGAFLVILSFFLPTKREMVWVLVSLTSLAVILEYLRLTWPLANRWASKFFGRFMRAGEETGRSGIPHYLLGCAISAIVFPRSIAILAILYLAFGDPTASFFGVKYGGRLWSRFKGHLAKSLEGSLACFLVCAVLTFFVSYLPEKTSSLPLWDRLFFSFLGGLGATLGEIFPLKTDDNLALPVLSGAFLWLTATVFNLIPGLYIHY